MCFLIKSLYFLLLVLAGVCYENNYEWSSLAQGWLKYHAVPITREEARLNCHAEGAVLASPLDDKLNLAIEEFVQKHRASRDYPKISSLTDKYVDLSALSNIAQEEITIFIGVHATFSNGDYTSVEGVPLLRMAINWAPEEPNNNDNAERCLAMTIDCPSTVADTRCDRKLPYVCYRKDTPTPAKKYRFDYEWSNDAGGWLKYHIVPVTWDEARPRCHAEGAILASPYNTQLEAAITKFIKKQRHFTEQGVTLFTGIKKTSERVYSSLEGVYLDQSAIAWASGVPEHYGTSKSCFAMTIGYNATMRHTSCNTVLPYVCYKKDTALTTTACGTDPEYHMEYRTGSCYKFHSKGLIWTEAFMTCVAEGGHLVIINNDVEADVIKNIISNHPISTIAADIYADDVVAVGFHHWGHVNSNNFMTIHGDSLRVNYERWGINEPNNSGGEFCGTVKRDALLNDLSCFKRMAYICEKKPNSLE